MSVKPTQQNIPDGWKFVKLKEISKKIGSGVTPRGGAEVYTKNGIMFLRSQNIQNGYLNLVDVEYISDDIDNRMGNSRVRKNDILYNITGASIGRSALYLLNDQANVNQHVCIVRLKEDNPRFINYFLLSWAGAKQLEDFQAGGNRQGLNYSQLGSFKFLLPPLPEQNRIVTVLETWDQAIEKLTRKIEIKKEVKKGLMQKLLAGKTRLNGCTSGWSNHELEQLLKLASEKYNPLSNQKSRKCIELEHLQKNDPELLGYVDSNNQKSIKSFFRKGDVLFGKLRPYLKKYLLAEFDGVCSTEIWVLKTTQRTHSLYMYYLIQTARFVSIANVSSGTHMPRADWDYMKNISFSVPDDLEEQKAIANILSTSDTEIRILVKKLNFLKDQKKYLLNNLITGTIRTPESLSIPN